MNYPIYYGDNDPNVCVWTETLIKAGQIPPGDVVCKSITDIQPDELRPYTQVHLFNGISGWARALQLAGCPADRPVWLASCPCPPFSAAGKKKNCPQCRQPAIPHPKKTGVFACIQCAYEWQADGRHLYPELLRLIEACRPGCIFGEQVSGFDGLVWLAGVRATLEELDYDTGAADLCAAGVRSPQLRQRLWWVAVAKGQGWPRVESGCECRIGKRSRVGGESPVVSVGNSSIDGNRTQHGESGSGTRQKEPYRGSSLSGSMADTACRGQRADWGPPGETGHLEQREQADTLADTERAERRPQLRGDEQHGDDAGRNQEASRAGACGEDGGMDDSHSGRRTQGESAAETYGHRDTPQPAGDVVGMGDSHQSRSQGQHEHGNGPGERVAGAHGVDGEPGFWDDWGVICTTDGKARRIPQRIFQSELDGLSAHLDALRDAGLSEEQIEEIKEAVNGFPLANRIPARVALLKGYGNAINPQVAAKFIRAVYAAIGEMNDGR